MNCDKLQDRIAIVTGAARGIGLATARALTAAGAKVTLADVDGAVLAAATTELNGENFTVSMHVCDVKDRVAIDRMMAAVAAAHGRVDILVNNAAVPDETAFASLTDTRLREVMAVNFEGAVSCVQAALPLLRNSKFASIVNVASTQGFRGQPNTMAYSASKASLISFTRALAVDLGPENIRANAVAPGFIDTRMAIQQHNGQHEHESEWFLEVYLKHGRLPLRRPGSSGDVAGPILFLASDDSRYVTGQVLVVDGGLTCTY